MWDVALDARASLAIRLLRATLFLIAPGLVVLHSVEAWPRAWHRLHRDGSLRDVVVSRCCHWVVAGAAVAALALATDCSSVVAWESVTSSSSVSLTSLAWPICSIMVMMALMMLINHETKAWRLLGVCGLLLIMAWTASKGPVVVWGVEVVDIVKREQDEGCQSIMLKSIRHV